MTDEKPTEVTRVETEKVVEKPDMAGDFGNVTKAVTGQPQPVQEKVTVTEEPVGPGESAT